MTSGASKRPFTCSCNIDVQLISTREIAKTYGCTEDVYSVWNSMLYFPGSFQKVMKWLISGTYHFIPRKSESYLQVQCHSRVQLQASTFQLGLLHVFRLHLCQKISHLFCKVEINMMWVHFTIEMGYSIIMPNWECPKQCPKHTTSTFGNGNIGGTILV